MPRPSRRRSPWRCCPLGSGPCLILPGLLTRWYPARSPGGKSSREPAWDGGAGGRRWARSGLLASAASPSRFLVLLLHGPRVSEKPRATAPGAERPAGESCCPNSPERLPHSSSGQMRKWGGRRDGGQVESATRPSGVGGVGGERRRRKKGRRHGASWCRGSQQEELQQVNWDPSHAGASRFSPPASPRSPHPLLTARPNTPIQTPGRAHTHAHSPSPSTLRRKAGKCIEDCLLKAEHLT